MGDKMRLTSKKGVELSLQTIIVLIIMIVVLIVMIVLFSDNFITNSDSISTTGKDILNSTYS